MWANITCFLKAVIPEAEKAGVRMTWHPNDPPPPIPDLCDGDVRIDEEGRVFLINRCAGPDGQVQEREIFQVRVSPKGEVFRDYDRKGSR